MKKLLLAATAVASLSFGAPAAQACTVATCPGTSVVCADAVYCHVCVIQPQGGRKCIL